MKRDLRTVIIDPKHKNLGSLGVALVKAAKKENG